MYYEDEFYFLTDKLHHDIYELALSKYITKKERIIVKIFKHGEEEVIMEVVNGKNKVINDTRMDKNRDILEMDLVFVKVLDRYISNYELPNMVYECAEGLGAWYRVKIDGFNPQDKDLKIFYRKKKVSEEEILNSNVSQEVKDKQLKFLKLTNGLRFTKPQKVEKIFNNSKKE